MKKTVAHILFSIIVSIFALMPNLTAQWVDMGFPAENGATLYWSEGDLKMNDENFVITDYTDPGNSYIWGFNGNNTARQNLPYDITGNINYDMAAAHLNNTRLPSRKEFQALVNNCYISYTNVLVEEGYYLPIDPKDKSWINGTWVNQDYDKFTFTGDQFKLDSYKSRRYVYGTVTFDGNRMILKCSRGESGTIYLTYNAKTRQIFDRGTEMSKSDQASLLPDRTPDHYMYCMVLTSKINNNKLYFPIIEHTDGYYSQQSRDIAYWTGTQGQNGTALAFTSDGLKEKAMSTLCRIRPVKDDCNGCFTDFGYLTFEITDESHLGAEIFIDGKSMGQLSADSEFKIATGKHTVELKNEPCLIADPIVVDVAYRATTVCQSRMKKQCAYVRINSNGATLTIDNRPPARHSWQGLLPFGKYKVVAKKQYCYTEEKELEINNTNDIVIDFQLTSIQLPITISTKPGKSEVYIDGRFAGKASRRALTTPLLTTGDAHTIVLRKNGYGRISDTLYPYQAETQNGLVGTEPQKHREYRMRLDIDNLNPWFLVANYATSINYKSPAFGITFGHSRIFGWYLSALTNINNTGFGTEKMIEDEEYELTGKSSVTRLSITAGLMGRFGHCALYLGAGYGFRSYNLQERDGSWVRYPKTSYKGIDAEAGLMFHFGHFVLSVGVISTNFSYWEGKAGIGFSIPGKY